MRLHFPGGAWLLKQAPTLLVLCGLLAIGLWGHHNEWKLPSLASLWGGKEKNKDSDKPSSDEEDKDPFALTLSEDGARKAGLQYAPATRQSLAQYVEAPAVLSFEHTRFAKLAPRTSGTVWKVLHSISADLLPKGTLLVLVAAPDVGTAKAEFLSARIQLEIRLKMLQRLQAGGDAVPERAVRDAELSMREARVRLVNAQQALGNLGLPLSEDTLRNLSDDQVARKVRLLGVPENLLHEDDLPGNLLPLVMPFDGMVIRRHVVHGEMVNPSHPMLTIANVRILHVEMDVRLEDANRVSPRQEVTFRTPDQSAKGRLEWISPEADAKTRTVLAHAEIANPNGQLRPETFGKAAILVQSREGVLTVPDVSLQWDGNCHRVFVRIDETTYQPHIALRGARSAGVTELLDTRSLLAASLLGSLTSSSGPLLALSALPATTRLFQEVKPGEEVVTAGSHVLKSELLKNRISSED